MSNNSSLPINSHPQTARDFVDLFIQNNLHIIQTRAICLTRRIEAISSCDSLKDSFNAISDVMSAPFLRLGRKFRESPITSQITAAAREFNNELAFAKLQASERIRALSAVENLPTPLRRTIERLGLRMSVLKLDLEDLIAANEADAPANATTNKSNDKTSEKPSILPPLAPTPTPTPTPTSPCTQTPAPAPKAASTPVKARSSHPPASPLPSRSAPDPLAA